MTGRPISRQSNLQGQPEHPATWGGQPYLKGFVPARSHLGRILGAPHIHPKQCRSEGLAIWVHCEDGAACCVEAEGGDLAALDAYRVSHHR